MIDIRVLASGSTGNCYLLDDGESPLLIEAGIPIAKIREGTGFRIGRLAGCITSHLHADHCKAVRNLMALGVDCFMSQPTADALKLSGHRLHVVKHDQLFNVGPWAVKAFEVEHDCAGALGFLIVRNGETTLFLTDTAYSKYRFHGVNRLMIECNFDEDIIRENVASGEVDRIVKRRTYASHMSINRVLDFIKANDLSQLREVVLIHLSDSNSDAEEFKHRVAEVVGVPVFVA